MLSRRWELEQISLLGEVIGSSCGKSMRSYQPSRYTVPLYPTLESELERLGKVLHSILGVEKMRDWHYGTVELDDRGG